MDNTKSKANYSRNEKILRAICYIGISLSIIVGALLFFIENYNFEAYVVKIFDSGKGFCEDFWRDFCLFK